ncbi:MULTISPECIES: hypothetical protein [Streptomyces]|jgi:predicted DNA-binding transcriptional regulator AlpA|uniref:Uncharacterized protein n=1 Tax=Streptomyces sp. R02 TaxID=3238623 RepID=A0AB39LGH3_9ACTN|nr:hypothetical protein [Streptomyces viridodiastaticus]MCX4624929.1 hypothetical protein [Streptomyces viridodiastaticus]GHG00526.1 hypothetical protein GCM10018777_08990 [Streptomyces viridodiastaticus]
MAARSVPRLVEAAEIAAEYGLTPARISALYLERETNGFPEIAGKRGRARQWNKSDVDQWFAQRKPPRLQQHKPPALDPNELLTGAQASRFLGYKNPQQVNTYLRDHPGYFPEPDAIEELGTPQRPYRRPKWRVQTLLDWQATRPGSGRRSVKRSAPALPDVPVDGDPDELLGASQAAALLGFKSLNSFSSSLGQGNLPLLQTVDAVTEKGGRRRWTRRRILEQAAQRQGS